MSNEHDPNYSIIPSSGSDPEWFQKFVVPQGKEGSLSSAGWTINAQGFPQHTFLGASVRSFSLSAGFGDSSSTLSVQLVDDEYNNSDGVGYGDGDDPYHDGNNDLFRPPAVGSPVWFKFGANPATVEQAWRKTFDDTYGYNTIEDKPFPTSREDKDGFKLNSHHYVDLEQSTEDKWYVVNKSSMWDSDNKARGRDHFVFGGILQGYTENTSQAGRSLYTINIVDPREILSDCVLLFSNYQGTTFNNKNLFNIYGFLEYDPSDELVNTLDSFADDKSLLAKIIAPDGSVAYGGNGKDFTLIDMYDFGPRAEVKTSLSSSVSSPGRTGQLPRYFPVTGQGFSRRSERGMPFYRGAQALTALFEYFGEMPKEYIDAGFGGRVNFRGFNYVVDFSGIPTNKIPSMYYMDFDKLDLLSFAQELCDIISHELFVSLLPIIDHPACDFLEEHNEKMASEERYGDMVMGIIRLDAIDKSEQPQYGAILSYLQDLSDRGVEVENKDVGFELSNVTTDKFIVGAQEVEMYYFHCNKDRDELQVRREAEGQTAVDTLRSEQWLIETGLKQQILPFYGFLGDAKAISIPRGFGPYQQILLDTTGLNAYGVGNYYIATELELRAALVSYDRWSKFLLKYNETYVQDIDQYGATWAAISKESEGQINSVLDRFSDHIGLDPGDELEKDILDNLKNRKFAVTVPRCVWDSDRPFMGEDGLPASPCSPPFGYPLYYKRATKIGIPEAGVNTIIDAKTKVMTNTKQLKDKLSGDGNFMSTSAQHLTEQLNYLRKRMINFEENWKATHPGKPAEDFAEAPKYKSYMKEYKKVEKRTRQFEKLRNKMKEKGEVLLADTMNTLEQLGERPMFSNLSLLAKNHLENAKKVYAFLKKIAEENLGKKFLVKIPKACNVRYQRNIITYDNGGKARNIAAGPFGFAPMPINANAKNQNFLEQLDFTQKIGLISLKANANTWFSHYLNVGIYLNGNKNTPSRLGTQTNFEGGAYTYGALKNNFNPITEAWEFNYKPEPQGGFFNYGIYDVNISATDQTEFNKLPLGTQQALCPKDVQKFVTKGRIGCYARYDNSHFLNFAKVQGSEMSQQSLSYAGNSWVPDIVEELPNTRADQKFSFNLNSEKKLDDEKALKQPPSIAFVKCQLDEDLYMPPRLSMKSLQIFGRDYDLALSNVPYEIKEVKDEDGCPTYEMFINRLQPVFTLPKDGGVEGGASAPVVDFDRYFDPILQGNIINTQVQNLDSNHVYALITVPGRIQSTIDQRWMDGPMQVNNTVDIKNLMTQDVVKIPAFSKPAFPEKTDRVVSCSGDKIDFSFEQLTEIQRIQRQAVKGIGFSEGEVGLQHIQPSPVYPSMVAIPLLSWERCYGPWISAASLSSKDDPRIRYSNLGGKIEFIKDENLAPWNYSGFQLMNEAGKLKAEFSNSLLLISERGGFAFPAAPSGIALAKALKTGGPLVTSISVEIGESVKTTVKLDLYTAQYGKLQKQKEGAIAKLARERQKIIDQNNNALRRGLGKSSTSQDLLGGLMKNGGETLRKIAGDTETFFTEAQQKHATNMYLAGQADKWGIVGEEFLQNTVSAANTAGQAVNEWNSSPTGKKFLNLAAGFSVVTKNAAVIPTAAALLRRYMGNPNDGDGN